MRPNLGAICCYAYLNHCLRHRSHLSRETLLLVLTEGHQGNAALRDEDDQPILPQRPLLQLQHLVARVEGQEWKLEA